MIPSAIVQARMGSTRLPGKVMFSLAGKPVLWHVLDRISAAKTIKNIIIATTTLAEDDLIEEKGKEWGYHVFRGSANNVLNRYVSAAKEYNANPIVRITADCPLIDPEIIDEVLTHYLSGGYDMYGLSGEFPDGLDVTVFSLSALEKSDREAKLQSEREHIGQYIETHKKQFNVNGYCHRFPPYGLSLSACSLSRSISLTAQSIKLSLLALVHM